MSDIIRIPEVVVPGKPLGRHIHHDPRSRAFPAEQAVAVVSVTHVSTGLPLTQTRGSCTAEALCGARDTEPNTREPILVQADADRLYDEEIVLEGGNPATDDPGGDGLTVCKAAVTAGLITSYTHAFGIDEALAALVIRPVITGVNWFDSFDTPDPTGLVQITKTAKVRGGHELAATAIDAVEELIWLPNSWGLSYGVPFGGIPGGCLCMRWDTWDQLLQQGGDVTVPITT
jgi:hypothetical protein